MTYVYESKNDDPNGCPDTVIGECEAICARCQRDMHDELLELRAMKERARQERDRNPNHEVWTVLVDILGDQ